MLSLNSSGLQMEYECVCLLKFTRNVFSVALTGLGHVEAPRNQIIHLALERDPATAENACNIYIHFAALFCLSLL